LGADFRTKRRYLAMTCESAIAQPNKADNPQSARLTCRLRLGLIIPSQGSRLSLQAGRADVPQALPKRLDLLRLFLI